MTNRLIIYLSIFVMLAGSYSLAEAQNKPVKKYGSFWRVWTDGEHASGYSLDLWTHGKRMIGIIRIHRGLVGDPPAGLLNDVKYDARSHTLSFTAATSLGLFYDKDHDGVPSQEVLTFRGSITRQRLWGSLSTKNLLCKRPCRKRKNINLPRSAEWTGYMKNFSSLVLWQDDMKTILDRDGPKW